MLEPFNIIPTDCMCASACSHGPETDNVTLVNFMLYEARVALSVKQSKKFRACEILLGCRQCDITQLAAMRRLGDVGYIDARQAEWSVQQLQA